jgi:hypothetical protein
MMFLLPPLRPTLAIARSRRLLPGVNSYSNHISFRVKQRSSFTTTKSTAPSGGIGGGISGRGPRSFKEVWNELRASPLQYATIPAVAAFLGLYTNWVGVKMLFYPIEYTGTEWYASKFNCVIIKNTHSAQSYHIVLFFTIRLLPTTIRFLSPTGIGLPLLYRMA